MELPIEHLHAIELPTPFPVGPINVYLADAPDEPLTLIDTGPRAPETRSALQAGLRALGYEPAALKRIIVTHAHVDHYGLAAELVAGSGAELLSHAWNIPNLADDETNRQKRLAFYGELLRQAAVPPEIVRRVGWVTQGVRRFAQPVNVDVALGDGDVLRLAGRDWQVLHTPGHSAGLLCFYEPQSCTLLSSDHLLAYISSNPVVEPPPPGTTERYRSLVLYSASLRRVAAMQVAAALPSHGPVIRNVPELVAERLEFHERRLKRVLDVLSGEAHTTWEITQALFPDRPPLDTFLALSEVVGHLDVLELEGKIRGEQVDGVIHWRAVMQDV